MSTTSSQHDAIQDIYPLSPVQQGMLFHSLLTPESGVYVVQVGFTLNGPLDRGAFNATWRRLVARHDVLRTACVWEGVKQPLQVVGKQAELSIELVDDASAAGFSLDAWLEVDRRRGVPLGRAPLMRVSLLPLEEESHRVVWSYHHLILDGWSLPILMRDWTAIYSAEVAGKPEPPPVELRFRDYLAWLARQDQETALAFWREELRGFREPTPLVLATHRQEDPAATDSTSGNGQSCLALSEELTQGLTEFARRERLTLGTLVQAAWAVLLSRYADREEVIFGLVRSGRPAELPQFERRVGAFLNTLPARVLVRADQPVVEWLRELQAVQRRQTPHEFASLSQVHSACDAPRDAPLFESVVVFENYPMGGAPVGGEGLSIDDVWVEEQTNYPLSLYAAAGERLDLRLRFDSQRFTQAAIDRLGKQVERVLERITHAQSGPLRTVGELTTPRPDEFSSHGESRDLTDVSSVPEMISRQASRSPDAIALVCSDRSLSYAELEAQAERFAERLLQWGGQLDAPIGILLSRSVEMLVAVLGVLKAGGHYVPLDPSHPEQRLRAVIEDSGLRFLVTANSETPLIPAADAERFDTLWLLKPQSNGSEFAVSETDGASLPANQHPESLAYLIYTSGSTGKPKGVPITHRNLSNLIRSMSDRLDFGPHQRLLAVTTLAFDIAALELLMPLCCGGTVVLADEETSRDAERLVATLSEQAIDTMQATPSTWRLLFTGGSKSGRPGLTESIRPGFTLLCGGESLDLDLAQTLVGTGADVWNVYGPTETTIWSGALKLSPGLLADGEVPMGGPLDNTGFFILDSNRKPCPEGVAGELCLSGAGLSPGYSGDDAVAAELTRDRFLNLELPDARGDFTSTRVYRTGDLVRRREGGHLEFLGRVDNQIKLRGHRIELGEIESALHTHAAVEQAVVFIGGADTPHARLVAVLQTEVEAGVTDSTLLTEIRESLATRLPPYMLPTSYGEMGRLPLTPNGKIDRKQIANSWRTGGEIRRLGEADEVSRPGGSTPTEERLASIWRRVLKVDAVDAHDNFFEIGGHSLLLLRAQEALRDELQVDLPLVDFFRFPTLRTLAAHLDNNQSQRWRRDRATAIQTGRSRLKARRAASTAVNNAS